VTRELVLGVCCVAAETANVFVLFGVFGVDMFFECSRRVRLKVAKLALERILVVFSHVILEVFFASDFDVTNRAFD